VRVLDPCAKSGVFLREITSRLTAGLAQEFPNLQERVNHILTQQVFGIGITRLTSLLARRSVYCSKRANGPHSIVTVSDSEAGNIWFERTEHTWAQGKCAFCGASQAALDRGEGLETHAYAFIHTHDIKARLTELFGAPMQFDVVIGNPPYQLDDGGYGTSAAPIYQLFVQNALNLEPRYAVFVTPSRWMAGGKGLDSYRAQMLADKRLRSIVDYPKLYEGFPGVKLRGGVSYFLWDRGHHGPCSFQTIWDGQPTGPAMSRHLDTFDVLVRRNEAVSILEKILTQGAASFSSHISSGKPFGLRTFFHGSEDTRKIREPVKLFGSRKVSWIERSAIPINQGWIDQWKVLMTAVQGTSAAVETNFLSKPIVAEPGTACTETYLVAGHFETKGEALSCASYLRTRFVRFLVSLRKATQHATRDVYAFVPVVPLDQEWTDAKLYQRYGLGPEEIAFIESQVAAHDGELFGDSELSEAGEE
jgi:site-specific DNA-methyltransferase (adenine-specific)